MRCGNNGCPNEAGDYYCNMCSNLKYCSDKCKASDWYSRHKHVCNKVPSFSLSDFEDRENILGAGSYGEVRLVYHWTSRTPYAMKVIKKSYIRMGGFTEAIQKEIAVHKSITHPNIIKLYEDMSDNKNIYLLLEYAENGTLHTHIQRKQVTADLCRKYFKQVCEAVLYLHNQQIVHRDIKPENILIDSFNDVKLCDFGWCFKGESDKPTYCGTRDYMAPEILREEPHYPSIDIWALGVLLYEMIHGVGPFSGGSPEEVEARILDGNVEFGKEASPEVKDLILKILKLNPEERLPIASILQHPYIVSPRLEISKWTRFRSHRLGIGMTDAIVMEVNRQECKVMFEIDEKIEWMSRKKVENLIKKQYHLCDRVENVDPNDIPELIRIASSKIEAESESMQSRAYSRLESYIQQNKRVRDSSSSFINDDDDESRLSRYFSKISVTDGMSIEFADRRDMIEKNRMEFLNQIQEDILDNKETALPPELPEMEIEVKEPAFQKPEPAPSFYEPVEDLNRKIIIDNSKLKQRQKELKDAIQKVEGQPERKKPRQGRADIPRRDKKVRSQDVGFLQWVGSFIGCTGR